MVGGAILSDIIAPPRSRRLTADFLWPSDAKKKKKKNPSNYLSKPLRSDIVDPLADDFEADFQNFKDYSDFDEDENDAAEPFTFSASKSNGINHFQISFLCAYSIFLSSLIFFFFVFFAILVLWCCDWYFVYGIIL